MQDSTSFSYSCISFSGSGEANHISVTSAVGLADDSMILDKMAKYQSKDLTTLFSKLGTLKHIFNLLCGLFLHLYIFLISFLILPPCSHYLTVQCLSLIWPVFCSNPKLELSSRSRLECFKLWMCLSIWEVFSYVEVSYFTLISRSSCLLYQNIKKTRAWHFDFLSSMHEQLHCVSHGAQNSSFAWLKNPFIGLGSLEC